MSYIVNKFKSLFRKKHYDSKKYWKERHSSFGFDLKGVGNKGLSTEENQNQYEAGKKVFMDLLSSEGIDLKGVDVLDIGCGNGFYASVYEKMGVSSYTGIDITDVLFKELMAKFPLFRFEVKDVGSDPIDTQFSFISMIDVTQHITDDAKFDTAMQNIKQALRPDGVFIVTSWLNKSARSSFYEKSREIRAYQRNFPKAYFSKPLEFRDKFIFLIKP